MTLTRISLQLWVLTACTGTTASPPGRPSPAQGPISVTPEATTLEETKVQLTEEIAITGPGEPARRFVTAFYVNDRTAADLLTDWLHRQEGVAAVDLHEGVTRTHARGAGSRDSGAVYLAEEIWWELTVESPPQKLGPGDVEAWIRILQSVPSDSRWRLGPSVVAGP
jgi:hypothetical protein